jgi:LacI family transcriptional regulator
MVTLKDIAAKAGVNISSVSKALNGSKEISPQKTMEIKQIARELNYMPNLSARALAGKGTCSIGVILPEIQSNYYACIMNNIETELSTADYSIIISTTNFDLKNEIRYLDILCSRAVDAILLIGAMNEGIEDYASLIEAKYNIPILFLESFIELRNHDYIMIDNRFGISLAVEHLKKIGFSQIGFISEDISARTRLRWFKDALKDNGLDFLKRFVKIGPERFELGGYRRMKELLAEPDHPKAVFASYDDMAVGALKAIHDAGLRVPEDISIIGFDNIRESEFLLTPLTTIVPPIKEMVSIGIKLLLEKIAAPRSAMSHRLILKPNLIVRSSTLPL